MTSLSCHVILVTLLLMMSLREIWTQAPGDEDRRCTIDHTSPATYPDTERNLMDSYNYQDLLPGNGTGNTPIATAVWNDYSFDGNDDSSNIISPTYWQQGAGGICRFQSKVCGWRRSGTRQNNWLFTQHIRQDFDSNTYNYNVNISVRVTYSVQSCRERSGCRQGFHLLHYMTNSAQLPSLSESGFMNTSNYQKFAEPYSSRSLVTYTSTYTFTLPPSSTGFYIAARDNGSCVTISRLRVYRSNCKSRPLGLVLYPDAPAPVSDSTNITVSCAPHSSIKGDGIATCRSDGTWGPETPQCECDCGYQENGGACDTRCQPGQFKAEGMGQCEACPANSSSDSVGACVCECSPYHYRTRMESPWVPCTAAPSEPRNITFEVTNTTLTMTWGKPASDGGKKDMFFNVSLCPVLGCADNLQVETLTETQYTFVGLKPVTRYRLVVQAENGVSDQDARVDLRTVVREVTTAEGEPEEVSNPKAVDNIVLVWGPPRVPNGLITGYQIWLEFCATEEEGSGAGNETDLLLPSVPSIPVGECENATCKVEANILFFVLNNDVLPHYSHNLTYRIRAKTGKDRYGVWSPEETIVTKFSCPRPPPCDCPLLKCSTTAALPTVTTTVIAPTTTTNFATTAVIPPATTPTTSTTGDPEVGAEQKQIPSIEECVIHMGVTAGVFILLTSLLSCIFSCAIACLCHKHKMKTYKIRVKKHLQSKWDY